MTINFTYWSDSMLLNPVERYYFNKGGEESIKEAKEDIIRKMLDAGYSIESIVEVFGF